MNYIFEDLKKSSSYIPNNITPKQEGFEFNGFCSYSNDYFLISRDAPVPTTRGEEIIIPYIQGSIDFSYYRGIRYFNNRKITFKIFKPNISYEDIKSEILKVRQALLSQQASNEILKESYIPQNAHWRGMCQDVAYEEASGGLILIVEFNLHPLLFIDIDPTNTDIWDEFNFTTDIAQEYEIKLNSNKEINFINNSHSKTNLHAQIINGQINPGAYVGIRNQQNPLKNTKNKQYIGNLEIGANVISFCDINSPVTLKLLFTGGVIC